MGLQLRMGLQLETLWYLDLRKTGIAVNFGKKKHLKKVPFQGKKKHIFS